MTRATCAAVRSGFSFFKADASSSTAASVRGSTWRGEGHSAGNPPARQTRIHLSRLLRDTCTGRPAGGLDLFDHRIGAGGAVVAVGLRHARVDLVVDPQERTQHRTPAPSKFDRSRRADPVVRARHDRGMTIHHHQLVSGPAGETRPGRTV